MIGIEFEIDNCKNIFKLLFKGVSLNNYDLDLLQLDAYYPDDFKYSNKDDPSNKKVEELIESQREYNVIFANIRIYDKASKFQEINTYEDFIKSSCQMIILIVDIYEIEIYFKENNLKKQVLKNINDLNAEYKIKTKDNDGRTKLYV